MTRSQQLLAIRPSLDLETAQSTATEAFQNQTLRPILKMQHDLLHALMKESEQFQKAMAKLDKSNPKAYPLLIDQFIKGNVSLRNKLVGMVIGLMTLEETKVYAQNVREYDKRIVHMLVQRLLD